MNLYYRISNFLNFRVCLYTRKTVNNYIPNYKNNQIIKNYNLIVTMQFQGD